ncbi:hypothetical protein KABACHOK_05780 [Brevundimonas phage vB_BpoS-Kabachok]|uniref:Uncharacterized protein n=1 Tax=Brevundimonas phage vB_BpoS-Kabachok TaxID=2948600 RepID=A0A9E7MRH6_9CAUD|nr:hypothetical protein KABACHOK_05780 [Brevundimonas phage vB_BpoS-Kabachok]
MTNTQPAHITVGGEPFCGWLGTQAGADKVREAKARDPGASCACGHMKTADAERSARALRPGFKRGRVKVVSGFCPAHRIGA